MIDDGRVYALTLVFQHLLRTLEHKGLLSPSDTRDMLDAVHEKLNKRGDVLSPSASADAARNIGALL